VLLGSLISSLALSVDRLTSMSGAPIAIAAAIDAMPSVNGIVMNGSNHEALLTHW